MKSIYWYEKKSEVLPRRMLEFVCALAPTWIWLILTSFGKISSSDGFVSMVVVSQMVFAVAWWIHLSRLRPWPTEENVKELSYDDLKSLYVEIHSNLDMGTPEGGVIVREFIRRKNDELL